MKTRRLIVTREEFAAVSKLADQCCHPAGSLEIVPGEFGPRVRERPPFDESAWEAGLRQILGNKTVDRMKRLVAEEPTTFALVATRAEEVEDEIRISITPGVADAGQ